MGGNRPSPTCFTSTCSVDAGAIVVKGTSSQARVTNVVSASGKGIGPFPSQPTVDDGARAITRPLQMD